MIKLLIQALEVVMIYRLITRIHFLLSLFLLNIIVNIIFIFRLAYKVEIFGFVYINNN